MIGIDSGAGRDAQKVAPTALPGDADALIIRVESLSKRYGRRGVQALVDVSFKVAKGRVFGLIGPDGAGKTSTIQVLAGVLRADSGIISVGTVNVRRNPEDVKEIIGYMPQGLGLNLYDSLTVEENVAFFRDLRRVPADRFAENRDRLLDMTRLAPFLDRPAGKLSGGMRQKLALVCTLIHLPDILLLDEPTTGVDPVSRRDFWSIIHDLVTSRGATVVLTTSYMDEAERCHNIALMSQGRIIAQGPPEEIADSAPSLVLAVRSAVPERIVDALRGWPEIESVALIGPVIRLLVRSRQADVGEFLRRRGIGEVQIEHLAPGLEDVFIHRLAQKEGRTIGEGELRLWSSNRQPPAQVVATTGVEREVAIIRADGLTCRFGDFIAVDDARLDVGRGEIFGLLGPNGAGKTTLIRMLCGLQKPSGGKASVAALDVATSRQELRGRIGYMSQRFSLYRDLSIAANMRLYYGLYGLPLQARESRIGSLLDTLGLAAYANRVPQALPLGLRQRLALACAMLHEPPVLFLDEPTSGVDPIARRTFWNIVHLLARRRGVSVMVSTHYMDEAEHCDRLGLMQRGKLIAIGSPAELKRQAEASAGPMVVARTAEFAVAFNLLRQTFPGAALYGRRIQWQTRAPAADIEKARALLAAAAIEAHLGQQELSMEETFVSFLEMERMANV
jgi:drug efflux transport system ATP-binding protein